MEKDNLIPANEFCINHHIDISFINSLNEFGLIEINTVEEAVYIDAEQLHKLESFSRLYHELEINMEGIDAISHLLQKIIRMQNEIIFLKNRLHIYEDF
jgi:hypothetical protein